ncbi:single-stranded DNA-binding protein [Tomitella gaofuii]|uniref:single-stranded DNA-binding protein n=1 Tax=Tomitella gaofuii TaxID=2760083 RepID=UPI0015FCAE23|nr:single-stranded DNA-binding protein [Tomitella gaofuii]
MANEPIVTIAGNLTADPELRFVGGNGDTAVCNFNIANTPRVKDGDEWVDGDTTFLRVTAWHGLAEHVADSLNKGDRVIVTGGLATQYWEDKEGNERTSLTLRADDVGPSLMWATASVEKASKSGGGGGRGKAGGGRSGGRSRSGGGRRAENDPWGSAPDHGGY